MLIRALEPLEGIEAMRERRSRRGLLLRDEELCSGPGKLTQALGVELTENRSDLAAGPVRIYPPIADPATGSLPEAEIVSGTRIGITKGVELPWRFCAAGNRHVSRPRPTPGGSGAARVSRWG